MGSEFEQEEVSEGSRECGVNSECRAALSRRSVFVFTFCHFSNVA